MAEKLGKKKLIAIIIAVVLVVAIIIGVVVASSSAKPVEQTTSGSVELITKRTIANSITANGTVEAANKEDVTGGSYGMTVEKVYVKEGDVVAAGDIICQFDTEDIDEQIKNTQENITEAQADKQTQLAEYDQDIAERKNSNAEDLAEAQADLNDAKAELTEAQAELKAKQDEYNAYIAAGNDETSINAIQMEQVIENKKSNVEAKQSRVDTYQSRVDTLADQDTSSLEDAKDNYAEQMDTQIENYDEQLKSLKEQREEYTIRAGISGTITSLNVTEDSSFSGGTIASIEGIDQFIVEAQVDEYDIADVTVGMKVLVKTDATRDEEMEGVITYVAPRATSSGSSSTSGLSSLIGMDTSSFTSSSSSSATYLVKIELNEQNDRLRLGMNAKTSIITEESVDVWSVPYDAIYTRADGTTYVEKVTGKDEEGNVLTEEMDVTIGLEGTYYVEIISDEITENTQILVPDAQGNSSFEELLNMMGADAGVQYRKDENYELYYKAK